MDRQHPEVLVARGALVDLEGLDHQWSHAFPLFQLHHLGLAHQDFRRHQLPRVNQANQGPPGPHPSLELQVDRLVQYSLAYLAVLVHLEVQLILLCLALLESLAFQEILAGPLVQSLLEGLLDLACLPAPENQWDQDYQLVREIQHGRDFPGSLVIPANQAALVYPLVQLGRLDP